MKRKKKKTKFKVKKRYYILFFLILFLISAFFSYKEFRMENPEENVGETERKEALPPKNDFNPWKRFNPMEGLMEGKSPQQNNLVQPGTVKKAFPRPKVAIVIDDLGTNKKAALRIFNIKAPLTLSVLPHETYSTWIAGEGRRRGYEVIGHIPMEPLKPHNLGKGAIYTWMTATEIRKTLDGDLEYLPGIKGISNHMGSAFTEDERAMGILMSELKNRKMFFLDSFTTARSAGLRLAGKYGVKAFKRDIFLDNRDDPRHIKAQWEKLIEVARKNGYAIALAHHRKSTLDFLEKTLPENDDVIVVPLSRLTVSR
ncbi:MAG: divergent polysaccharide deacetylase family protein [Nitrospirota bacterium]|nr:divergent polysaccharide deacetylase family protein [Nitrospirota bacterium]